MLHHAATPSIVSTPFSLRLTAGERQLSWLMKTCVVLRPRLALRHHSRNSILSSFEMVRRSTRFKLVNNIAHTFTELCQLSTRRQGMLGILRRLFG